MLQARQQESSGIECAFRRRRRRRSNHRRLRCLPRFAVPKNGWNHFQRENVANLDIADKVSHVVVALGKVEIVVGLDVELWLASLQGFCHAHVASSVEHRSLSADSDRKSEMSNFPPWFQNFWILLEPFALTWIGIKVPNLSKLRLLLILISPVHIHLDLTVSFSPELETKEGDPPVSVCDGKENSSIVIGPMIVFTIGSIFWLISD